MRDLITAIESWQTKTVSELVAILNASSVTVTDDELYTWAGVALVVGPSGAEALRVALETNGLGWAVHQLGGSGIQLSLPLTQQMLLAFAQAGVPGCAELAAVGVHQVSVCEAAGLPPATTETVEDALLSIEKESLLAEGAATYNAWVDAVNAWDGTGNPPALGA